MVWAGRAILGIRRATGLSTSLDAVGGGGEGGGGVGEGEVRGTFSATSFTTGVSLCSSSSNEAAAAVGVREELALASFTSSSSHHCQEDGVETPSSGGDGSSCSTSITSVISEAVLLRFRVGDGEGVLKSRFHLLSATMSS